MNDISQRLRMTPQEKRAAKVVGGALLGSMGIALLYFLGPALLAATWTLGIPLVLGGIMATIVGGFFAAMSETGQKFGSLLYGTFLVLFTKVLRYFIISESDEDEDQDEEAAAAMLALDRDLGIVSEEDIEEPEDPLKAIETLLRDLRSELGEHRENLKAVSGIVQDARQTEESFTAEAEQAREKALAMDEAGDERAAGKAIQLRTLKLNSAQRAAEERETAEALLEILMVLADRTELLIEETDDELEIQTLRARTHAVETEALPGDFQTGEEERRRHQAMSTLHRRVAQRAGQIEAQTTAARSLVSHLRIRDIATSRMEIASLRGNIEVTEETPPTSPAPVTQPTTAVPTAPTSPREVGESPEDRRSRIRKALGARTPNKKSL